MRTTKLIILSLIATLASFGQCVLVFNPLTNQFNCGGGATGGSVGGASNLTTVGAIPYVSASGVLNQDGTGLKYDSTGKLVYVAAATAAETAIIGRYTAGSLAALYLGIATPSTSNYAIAANGTSVLLNAPLSTGTITFNRANTESARFAATTGNFLIGTTTDSNFKLDVAASGSAGTARFYGGAGVSNSTKVVVQAGGGQSGNLQEWQNSGGSVVANVLSNGSIYSSGAIYNNAIGLNYSGANELLMISSVIARFTSGNLNSSPDLSISRASAGVLQVGDGGSNANGELQAKIHTWINGTEATCNSTTRGEVVMVQGGAGVADTLRVCRKDAADAYAWTALY